MASKKRHLRRDWYSANLWKPNSSVVGGGRHHNIEIQSFVYSSLDLQLVSSTPEAGSFSWTSFLKFFVAHK